MMNTTPLLHPRLAHPHAHEWAGEGELTIISPMEVMTDEDD